MLTFGGSSECRAKGPGLCHGSSCSQRYNLQPSRYLPQLPKHLLCASNHQEAGQPSCHPHEWAQRITFERGLTLSSVLIEGGHRGWGVVPGVLWDVRNVLELHRVVVTGSIRREKCIELLI